MSARKRRADIEAAVEHILWCAEWQADGYVVVSAFNSDRGGRLKPGRRHWVHNDDADLAEQVRAVLNRYRDGDATLFYSACSFSRKNAKAEYANPCALAYVDADGVVLPDGFPRPTRVVASSNTGEHWFWALSADLEPNDLQRLSKAVTYHVGGDKGGHSPAKLFRLPGFFNHKYDPPVQVRVDVKPQAGERPRRAAGAHRRGGCRQGCAAVGPR